MGWIEQKSNSFLKNEIMGYLEDKADKVINNHVLVAMGAGAIPVPIVDVAAVTAIQLDMIRELSYIYDADFSESLGKNVVSAVAGGTLAKIGASLVKTIPVVGSFLGGVGMVALSGASTYAMGQVFINHLKSGGILSNFDFDWAKKMYKEEFEKGKKYAQDLAKDQKSKGGGSSNGDSNDKMKEVFSAIEQLNDLKERGILSDDEFQAKKEELLKQI
ncbi:MAG: DUF697 domain-containing protein [Flammeovirgaceae bacterium]